MPNPSKTKCSICLLIAFLLTFCCFTFLSSSIVSGESANQVSEQENLNPQLRIPEIEYANKTVYVGVWILNIYDFNYRNGLYTFKMFVYFFWVDPGISAIDWNFINGYPVPDSQAKQLVDKGKINETNYEIYSVTARFSQPPTDSNYPFDHIQFLVAIEITEIVNNVNLLWLRNQSGVSPDFNNPGWKTTSVNFTETKESNPLKDGLPRVELNITQERILPGMIFLAYLPPLIFAVLGCCSFLFVPKTIALVGTRIALISSLIVSMIVFVFTVLSFMPITSTVPRYAIFLLAIIIFLTTCLFVSIVSLAYLVHSDNRERASLVNRIGFIIAVLVPVLFLIPFYF